MTALLLKLPLMKLLGASTLFGIVITVWFGLDVTAPDAVQGEFVRLIYLHPQLAWTCYTAFGVTTVASALYLYPKTRNQRWALIAGASAEIGVVFCGLTLITGSIWGKPTWGVWWTWDARLVSTAVLFVLFPGYLALRRIPGESTSRAKRCAIAAIIAAIDIPIVHLSVEWWRTLHQGRTLLRPDPTIHGVQLFTMLFSFTVFTMLFVWLLVHRYRVEKMESELETQALDLALHERRNEAKLQAEAETTRTVGAK